MTPVLELADVTFRCDGKHRMEGKDYVMADGDVVEFRFQTTFGGKAAANK